MISGILTLVINFQEASILFVDSPVGTGYSYAKTSLASQAGDFKQVQQVDQFLRKVYFSTNTFLCNIKLKSLISGAYIVSDSMLNLIVAIGSP